jgi:F0F1-type ATP synthase membrane subunit b/b'
MRDSDEVVTAAIAAADRSEREVAAKVEEAEERRRGAEERAREIEADAAAAISEVRQAAADWLRQQIGSARTNDGE